jgi:hypothetical protein
VEAESLLNDYRDGGGDGFWGRGTDELVPHGGMLMRASPDAETSPIRLHRTLSLPSRPFELWARVRQLEASRRPEGAEGVFSVNGQRVGQVEGWFDGEGEPRLEWVKVGRLRGDASTSLELEVAAKPGRKYVSLRLDVLALVPVDEEPRAETSRAPPLCPACRAPAEWKTSGSGIPAQSGK